MITDEYIKEVSAAYWQEEEELKAGIHPTQVKERIEKCLKESEYQYSHITFLDWGYSGARVGVY